MKINRLSEKTINKIAAGEVIERPVSIVKELVENSIDALAKNITVKVDLNNFTIDVIDDGIGIEYDDIRLSVQNHCTSKIKSDKDLKNCFTLGFRGEALASIASISNMKMITKCKNKQAYEYVINAGKEISFNEISANDGTKIFIKDLFHNVPVRKEFLKKNSIEINYITKLIIKLALSRPDISFKYLINNKEKVRTFGFNNLKKTIYEIFGLEYVKNIIEINFKNEDLEIKGYIGNSTIVNNTKLMEYIFVNGRIVKNFNLNKAVELGYNGFIMKNKYPFVCLNINFNLKNIDINVHPTKSDIRISNIYEATNTIMKQINNVLSSDKIIPVKSVDDDFNYNKEYFLSSMKRRVSDSYKNEISFIKEVVESNQINMSDLDNDKFSIKDDFKILGQIFDTYILVLYQDDFIIIDQHAAHEKIIYEKIELDLKKGNITSQFISPEIIVNLKIDDDIFEKTYKNIFKKYGFIIEYYGGNDYIISGLPNIFSKNIDHDILKNLTEEIFKNNDKIKSEVFENKIKSMACRIAIKGNMKLSNIEMEELVKKLINIKNPYNCPHGRPIMIRFNKKNIEKMFKRIL